MKKEVSKKEYAPADRFLVYWNEEENLCKSYVVAKTQEEAEAVITARLKKRGVKGKVMSAETYAKKVKKA